MDDDELAEETFAWIWWVAAGAAAAVVLVLAMTWLVGHRDLLNRTMGDGAPGVGPSQASPPSVEGEQEDDAA